MSGRDLVTLPLPFGNATSPRLPADNVSRSHPGLRAEGEGARPGRVGKQTDALFAREFLARLRTHVAARRHDRGHVCDGEENLVVVAQCKVGQAARRR